MPGPIRYRLSGVRARAPKAVDIPLVARVLGVSPEGLSDLVLVRRSLDARQKPALFWDLTVEFSSEAPLAPRLFAPLRLTDAPEPFIGFERGIALRNVADPDPPDWLVALLATHPPTVDRIGIAKAFEAGAR